MRLKILAPAVALIMFGCAGIQPYRCGWKSDYEDFQKCMSIYELKYGDRGKAYRECKRASYIGPRFCVRF